MADETKRRYDAVLKDLFQTEHPALLDEITGGVPVREYLNIEFPSILERRADLVLLLEDGTIKHLEFQSDNDKDMVYREGIYGLLIGQRYRCRVSQVVLYFGPEPMGMSARVDLGGIQVSYRLMDIRELDAESLLRTGRPGDLALAMLARGGTGLLRAILEKTKALGLQERNRALILLTYLSGLRRLSDELRLEIKAMGTTYIDIEENAILKEWFAESNAKATAVATAKILRQQLTAKFGQLPDWADDRLSRSTVAELDSYVLKVLSANSIQDALGPE